MRPTPIRTPAKTATAGRPDPRALSGRRARRAFAGRSSRNDRRQAGHTLTPALPAAVNTHRPAGRRRSAPPGRAPGRRDLRWSRSVSASAGAQPAGGWSRRRTRVTPTSCAPSSWPAVPAPPQRQPAVERLPGAPLPCRRGGRCPV